MKKFLAILLAASVLGVSAFAQAAPAPAATIGAYLQTSATLADNAYAYGAGNAWSQVNLGFDAGFIGFKSRSVMNFNTGTAELFGASTFYYVWTKFIDKMVTVSVGKVGFDNKYSQTGYVEGGNVMNTDVANNVYGIAAEVAPIDGLTIGMYAPLSTSANWNGSSVFLKYSNPTVGTINAGYELFANELFANASIGALVSKDVTLKLGYDLVTTTSVSKIFLTAGYANLIPGLANLGFDSSVYLSSATTGFSAEAYARYVIADPFSAGIKVGYTYGTTNAWSYGANSLLIQPLFRVAYGNGQLTTSFKMLLNTTTSALTWSIPVAAELWF